MVRVAAVGLGLIGGSVSAALRRAGHTVAGTDTHPGRAAHALELGLIDRAASDLDDCVWDAEVVVLAAPVPAILSLLAHVDDVSPPDALILDTGSVKTDVVAAMSRLRHAGGAIGGHPIAGSELSGPDAAGASILAGRPFALCPSARTTAETVRQARVLVEESGSVPVVVNAARHDAVLARTSHLPQLASTALALSLEAADLALSGPGLQSMTRLAASNPELWTDILLLNRSNVSEAMHAFAGHVLELARMLDAGDGDSLLAAMREGAQSLEPASEVHV